MLVSLKNVVGRLRKSELVKNISTLAAGTALAQLIPILISPILRRYYTPEAYGAYTVYLSLIGILIVVSSLKYELAIILPRKDKQAANLFFLTVILSFLINILLLLIILVWKSGLVNFLNIPEKYGNFLYFVPLATFLFSFYQSANYWLIHKKRFLAISLNKFIRRGTEGSSQIGLKFIHSSYGLIWGDILGHIANVISISSQMLKSGLSVKFFSRPKLNYVAKKYKKYPKFNVIPSMMSACSYLLPAILINKIYSSENAGFFDLSKLVLSIPFALIATSISNVLLQRIAEKYKSGKSLVRELTSILGIVIIIAATEVVVIRLFGVELFKLVFGDAWEVSGQISRILVWSFALNFVVGSFSSIFMAMDKIKILSLWQLVYFLAILSLILFKDYHFIQFLRVYVLIEVSCYLLGSLILILIIFRFETSREAAY